MPVRKPDPWWRRSRAVAWAAAFCVIAAALGAVALSASPGPALLGFGLFQFLGAVLFPLLLGAVVVRVAAWQDTADRAYSVWEED